MRPHLPKAAYAAAALAAFVTMSGPAFTQTHSPFTGASPDTVILTGGWEMTPAGSVCTLVHAGPGGHADLAIRGEQGRDTVQLGLVLPPTGATYSAPIQLVVMAQTTVTQQIGRVTFTPAVGRLGTLLTADWPIDRLFPRLVEAARLNFYAPDQHLVRSVRLSGSAAAITSFERCLGYAQTGPIPAPVTAPVPADAPLSVAPADGGWTPLFDQGGCSIVRRTQRGNELSLVYNRRGNLMVFLRLRDGPTRLGRQATLLATPIRTVGYDAPPVDTDMATLVQVHADTSHGPAVFGRLNPEFLQRIEDPRWNAVALAIDDGGRTMFTDRVDTGGVQVPVTALRRCEKSMAE